MLLEQFNQFLHYLLFKKTYHNNPEYWDRQASANSVDPDQMLHSAASDLGLHYLPYIQQNFRHIKR